VVDSRPHSRPSSAALNSGVGRVDTDDVKQGLTMQSTLSDLHVAPDPLGHSRAPIEKRIQLNSIHTTSLQSMREESHYHSQRATPSPYREESLQYPSPTPSMAIIQSRAPTVEMEPSADPNSVIRRQPSITSGQSSSALQNVQQSYRFSFTSAKSSVETAAFTFSSAYPNLTNTQSTLAHTSLSLIAAESSIQASENALEASQSAFESAQSALNAANKAMNEAYTVMQTAKRTMQATKEGL
jgi:hypothetical protein